MPRRFQGPGPGQYNVKSTVGAGARAYTMLGRPQDLKKFVGPGPSSYLPNISVSSELRDRARSQYSFGTSDRFKSFKSVTPGPAEYTPCMKPSIGGEPMAGKIGKAARSAGFSVVGGQSPGPGAYNPGKTRGGGRTMAKRYEEHHLTISPGPAAYVPDVASSGAPSWGFGGAARGTGFGLSREAPGPGAYDLKRELGGRSCSLTPRRDNIFDLV